MRSFLGAWLLVAVVLGVGASGYLLQRIFATTLETEFDRGLESRARAIGNLLEYDDGQMEFVYLDEAMAEYAIGSREAFFEIDRPDGTTYARSPSLAERNLRTALNDGSYDLQLGDGPFVRVLSTRVPVRVDSDEDDEEDNDEETNETESPTFTNHGATITHSSAFPSDWSGVVSQGEVFANIRVAVRRDPLDASIQNFRWGLFSTLLAMAAGIVLFGRFILSRGLRPLDELAASAGEIDERNLDARLKTVHLPPEVASLGEALNDLLQRLESAFLRERRMTANLAHELRTPVAELRSASDVATEWSDDEDMRRDLLLTSRSVSLRMSVLIDGLLRLARIEAGELQPLNENFDLQDVIEETLKARSRSSQRDDVAIHIECEDVQVCGDQGLTTMVVGILLENALQYSVPQSHINISCEANAISVAIDVINESQDLTTEDIPRLAEPFWRKDKVRTEGGHAGLGLSLATRIAQILGGELQHRLDGKQVVATFTFPRIRPSRTSGIERAR